MANGNELTITTTARCTMTLFVISLFALGAAFFWSIPFVVNNNTNPLSFLCAICGTFYLILAIHRIMEFCNRQLTVTADGKTFVSFLGKKTYCPWEYIQIDAYSTRGFKMVFNLNKKKNYSWIL